MVVWLVARLVLAAIFAVAALAKLRDLPGSRRMMVEFGAPRSLAGLLGTLLPLTELAIAVALVPAPTAAGAALAAMALLAAFCVAIGWNIAAGRRPDCSCFGSHRQARISARTMLRNACIAILAGAVAWRLGRGEAAAVLAVAGSAAVVLAALASRRRFASRVEGLPVGAKAPSFRLPALQGLSVTLDSLRAAGRPVLLIFTDPDCGPCIALAPRIAEWQHDHSRALTIAVLERHRNGHAPGTDEYGRHNVLIQSEGDVAELYHARGTPTAVLVDVDGRIVSAPAGGGTAIAELMAQQIGVAPADAAAPPELELERIARPTGGFGRPIVRRELLARAGRLAAGAAALAAPARVLAAVSPRRRGGCDGRCGPDQDCLDDRCKCTQRKLPDKCGRECTDFRVDPKNCGGCGSTDIDHKCGLYHGSVIAHEMCVGGKCRHGDARREECGAPPGSVCCTDPTTGAYEATDMNFDNVHCGRCGQSCRDGRDPKCCWGKCIDRFHDPNHCGECGKRCHSDEVCDEGKCKPKCEGGRRRCPRRGQRCFDRKREICCGGQVIPKSDVEPGAKCCGGRVVSTQSDVGNCGGCGTKCNGPFDTGECCQGTCCDSNASTCCPGKGCTNTSLDDKNCGGCGIVCGPNSYCRFGVCTCPVEPCP